MLQTTKIRNVILRLSGDVSGSQVLSSFNGELTRLSFATAQEAIRTAAIIGATRKVAATVDMA